MLKKFKNSNDLGYKDKQVQSEPTEAYVFLIKHITKITKRESCVRTNFVKSGINKTIRHINKTIRHINEEIQSEELEINKKTTTCADKDKQNSSAYDNNGEKKTSSMSKNIYDVQNMNAHAHQQLYPSVRRKSLW